MGGMRPVVPRRCLSISCLDRTSRLGRPSNKILAVCCHATAGFLVYGLVSILFVRMTSLILAGVPLSCPGYTNNGLFPAGEL